VHRSVRSSGCRFALNFTVTLAVTITGIVNIIFDIINICIICVIVTHPLHAASHRPSVVVSRRPVSESRVGLALSCRAFR
jgi:hypothetical protein